MELSAATTSLLVVLAIVVAFVALGLAGVALAGQRRVREAYRVFSMGSHEDVLTLLERHIEEVAQLRDEVGQQQRYADQLRSLISGCVSRLGTVRYDAFDDMGGRLSFSVALLDEHGDGTVITAINGRTETRAYAKPVVGASSQHNLSKEETTAIAQALGQQPARGEGGRGASAGGRGSNRGEGGRGASAGGRGSNRGEGGPKGARVDAERSPGAPEGALGGDPK